jgi:hypothetical protein
MAVDKKDERSFTRKSTIMTTTKFNLPFRKSLYRKRRSLCY